MSGPGGIGRDWLLPADADLLAGFDVALLDLDGTLYVGPDAVPAAPGVMGTVRERGVRPAFVTNNASRTPSEVADHLTRIGIRAEASEVVTSAQAGAALVAERVAPGASVLVVGGAGVRAALLDLGLLPVDRADARPAAVLQGWTPELSWRQLAEGAFALARGLPWVVTNTDLTIPVGDGIAPGNGSFVELLAGVVGRRPDVVAGKPQPPLLEQAVSRLSAERPLVVGDRQDTDIEGARAVGLPSLLVLTGVTTLPALLSAEQRHRPTYLAQDVGGLLRPHRAPEAGGTAGTWICGNWRATVGPSEFSLGTIGDGPPVLAMADVEDALRASCAAFWSAADGSLRPDDPRVLAAATALGEVRARSGEQAA